LEQQEVRLVELIVYVARRVAQLICIRKPLSMVIPTDGISKLELDQWRAIYPNQVCLVLKMVVQFPRRLKLECEIHRDQVLQV
jgi:hypothetical protein